MPASPCPAARRSPAAPAPAPSSSTSTRSSRPVSARRTAARRVRPACLSMFVSASCTIRYAVSPGRRGRRARPAPGEPHRQPGGRGHGRPARPARPGPAAGCSSAGVGRGSVRSTPSRRRISPSAVRPVVDTCRMAAPRPARRVAGSAAAVGQRHHHGEAVRDDVVHLAGDPGPLGGGGEPGLLVALALQRPARSRAREVGAAGCGTARAETRRRPARTGGRGSPRPPVGAKRNAATRPADLEQDRATATRRGRVAATVYSGDQQGEVGASRGPRSPTGPARRAPGEDRAGRAGARPAGARARGQHDAHAPRRVGTVRTEAGRPGRPPGLHQRATPSDRRAARVPGWMRSQARHPRRHCPTARRVGLLRRPAGGAATPPGDQQRGCPDAQHPEARPGLSIRGHAVRAAVHAAPALDGRYWQDVRRPGRGQQLASDGITKKTPTKVVMPAGGVPQQGAERRAPNRPAPSGTAPRRGPRERAPGAVRDARCVPLSSAWPRKNATKPATSMSDEHHAGEDPELGPQHRQPPGHRGQGGADHAGAVLAGDHQDAEHADGQLGEVMPARLAVDRR